MTVLQCYKTSITGKHASRCGGSRRLRHRRRLHRLHRRRGVRSSGGNGSEDGDGGSNVNCGTYFFPWIIRTTRFMWHLYLPEEV